MQDHLGWRFQLGACGGCVVCSASSEGTLPCQAHTCGLPAKRPLIKCCALRFQCDGHCRECRCRSVQQRRRVAACGWKI